MFSDLAVSQGSPVRRWTAIVSFTLQAALVAVALVYPRKSRPAEARF